MIHSPRIRLGRHRVEDNLVVSGLSCCCCPYLVLHLWWSFTDPPPVSTSLSHPVRLPTPVVVCSPLGLVYLAPLWFYSCLIDAESLPSVEKHRVHPKAFVIRDCLESELRPPAQRPPRPLSLLKQSLGRVGGLFPVLHCFGSDSRVTTTDCAGCAAAPCSCPSNVVPIAYDARQPPALPSLLI